MFTINSTTFRSSFSILAIGITALLLPTRSIAGTIQQSDSKNPNFSVEARKRLPWAVSVGLYEPTFSFQGISSGAGATVAISYRLALESFDVKLFSRGSTCSISAGGSSADISTSEIGLEALFRMNQIYAGLGYGFSRGDLSVTGTQLAEIKSSTILSVIAGYDFSPRFYGEFRWQTSSNDLYRAFSLSAGYRF